MFKVNLLQMDGVSDELGQELRQFNRLIDEFENVKRGILMMGSYESMSRNLNNLQEAMETERNKTIKLLSGVQDVRNCYNRREMDIIEYSEDANPKRKINWTWQTVPVHTNDLIQIIF